MEITTCGSKLNFPSFTEAIYAQLRPYNLFLNAVLFYASLFIELSFMVATLHYHEWILTLAAIGRGSTSSSAVKI